MGVRALAGTAVPIGGRVGGAHTITVWRLERCSFAGLSEFIDTFSGLPVGLYFVPLARPTWVSVELRGSVQPTAELPLRDMADFFREAA